MTQGTQAEVEFGIHVTESAFRLFQRNLRNCHRFEREGDYQVGCRVAGQHSFGKGAFKTTLFATSSSCANLEKDWRIGILFQTRDACGSRIATLHRIFTFVVLHPQFATSLSTYLDNERHFHHAPSFLPRRGPRPSPRRPRGYDCDCLKGPCNNSHQSQDSNDLEWRVIVGL